MTIAEPHVLKLAQALAELMGPAHAAPPPVVETWRYVTIRLAAAKTGFTEKAIRRKIEDGVWVEGWQYRRAPDRHVMIDMEGVQSWVEKAVVSKSAHRVSA